MNKIVPLSPDAAQLAEAAAERPMVVPQRFADAVAAHALAFKARRADHSITAPLVLILAGPPGSGKTRMAGAVLKSQGAHVETVSASLLGGEYEGQSAVPLREAYVECAMAEESDFSALIVDDFDLSAAGVGDDLTGTVNASLLNGLIMNLADNPFELRVAHPGRATRSQCLERPPMIVMTANDGGRIYGPLKRAGRATIFEWLPTQAEKIDMVAGLYPWCAKREIGALVRAHEGQQIAFFEQIGLYAQRVTLLDHLKREGGHGVGGTDVAELARVLRADAGETGKAKLAEAAKALEAEIAAKDRAYL